MAATRRQLLGGIACAAAAPLHARGEARLALFASGYAGEGSPGLVPLGYDVTGERWRQDAPVPAARDASFGVYAPRWGLHYLVEEAQDGAVAVFRASGTRWEGLARVSTGGASPCHLALDRRQSVLAVANYSGGSIALFRLDPANGLPVAPAVVRVHSGSGPNRDRQQRPHAHWVGFSADDRWLWAVDLGADAIFAYPFDARAGTIGDAAVAYRGEPGSGPRHLALHPRLPRAYLVNELGNSVTALRTDGGGMLRAVATHPTLPPGFTGKSNAGAIAFNAAGTRLYVSNRGHDSIAVFAVGRDGALALIQHVGSGGRTPRYMRLLDREERLLVANQGSGRVSSFRVASDGRLAPIGPGAAVPGVAFVGVMA